MNSRIQVGDLIVGTKNNVYNIYNQNCLLVVRDVSKDINGFLRISGYTIVLPHFHGIDCCSTYFNGLIYKTKISGVQFKRIKSKKDLRDWFEILYQNKQINLLKIEGEYWPYNNLDLTYKDFLIELYNFLNTKVNKEINKKANENIFKNEISDDNMLYTNNQTNQNENIEDVKIKWEQEMFSVLERYSHNPSKEVIGQILNKYIENKGWILRLFQKHYAYNGNGQIVLGSKFKREMNFDEIIDFLSLISNHDILTHIKCLFSIKEKYDYFNMINDLKEHCISQCNGIIDENLYQTLQSKYNIDTYNINKGMKISRLINKICLKYQIPKIFEKNGISYHHEFAKFSDAINSSITEQKVILSVNPIDYLTMSFGNSWTSCHTIDKNNVRRIKSQHSYHGAYCSGTMSYLLDNCSFVFYIIDKKYQGNNPELENKISRCMFHLNNDYFIQARVYPQGNDGNHSVRKQYRQIVERVLAECVNLKNEWLKIKIDPHKIIISQGTNYEDYFHYDTDICKIKNNQNKNTLSLITIGYQPCCVKCGKIFDYYDEVDQLLCKDCLKSLK